MLLPAIQVRSLSYLSNVSICLCVLQGTTNCLEAAAREKSVKHLVLTSSFASMLDMAAYPSPGKVYTDDDWNPATYDEAKDKSKPPPFIYCASKKLAEKAAWDFVQNEKPGWSLTTLAPPMIFGPPLQPVKSLDNLNNSSSGSVFVSSRVIAMLTDHATTRRPRSQSFGN
jgi:nucleoside-diphosphate-sugar epimerase